MTTEKKKKATRRRIKKKNAVTREPANKAAKAAAEEIHNDIVFSDAEHILTLEAVRFTSKFWTKTYQEGNIPEGQTSEQIAEIIKALIHLESKLEMLTKAEDL
tara:strand:+ start:27 stop:335 length:309 start_codon:yes stop_codon:yes gene_type:complete